MGRQTSNLHFKRSNKKCSGPDSAPFDATKKHCRSSAEGKQDACQNRIWAASQSIPINREIQHGAVVFRRNARVKTPRSVADGLRKSHFRRGKRAKWLGLSQLFAISRLFEGRPICDGAIGEGGRFFLANRCQRLYMRRSSYRVDRPTDWLIANVLTPAAGR